MNATAAINTTSGERTLPTSFLLELPGNQIHVLLRALDGHAGLQPREDGKEVIEARLILLGREIERRPQVDRFVDEPERRRQHADDFVRLAVECDVLPDDAPVAAEAPLPDSVIEHHDASAAGLLFLGSEVTAERGRDAQHAEEGCGDVGDTNLFRFAGAAGQRLPRAPLRGNPVEDLLARAPVEEVGWRHDVVVFPFFRTAFPDHHEFAGAGVGQLAKQHGVDDAEDGAVGADAEREGDDDEGGEPGVSDEHPACVAPVLQQCAHPHHHAS
jgi:hypothetical protein